MLKMFMADLSARIDETSSDAHQRMCTCSFEEFAHEVNKFPPGVYVEPSHPKEDESEESDNPEESDKSDNESAKKPVKKMSSAEVEAIHFHHLNMLNISTANINEFPKLDV